MIDQMEAYTKTLTDDLFEKALQHFISVHNIKREHVKLVDDVMKGDMLFGFIMCDTSSQRKHLDMSDIDIRTFVGDDPGFKPLLTSPWALAGENTCMFMVVDDEPNMTLLVDQHLIRFDPAFYFHTERCQTSMIRFIVHNAPDV